jgi:hypothetical protein
MSIAEYKRAMIVEREVNSLKVTVGNLMETARLLLERVEPLEAKRGPGRPRKEDGYGQAASSD